MDSIYSTMYESRWSYNNGPGRCAVKSRIDMNRCFPRGFTAQYNSRNYTGSNPLGAQEAVALKEFIEKINRTADELVVIDGHGWLGCTYGDSSIAQYFTKQFGFSHNGPSGGGYFSYWAQGLPRTRGLLLEYPDTYSYGEVISRNYIGKTFNAIINILKNNPNGKAEDVNTNSSTSKWEKKDNKWYYYENGNMVTGWKLVDGKWYYLESNGVMAIGWKELGGIWYYLNESGAMVKGWQTISGKTYYFNDSGHMLVGKQVIDGRNYNFNTSGQLDSTNWVKSNNKWYYYENGKMITGWKLINGEWYYLEGSGVMATGWKELGGIWYYLNESGAMVKGWQTISGKTYYFNDSGHMLLGKQTIDGKSYEFNGSGQLISDTGDISLSESTYIATGEVIDVQTILNVRKGPGTNYDSIGQLHQGDKVSIVAKNGEWYKISSPIVGYVNSDYIIVLHDDTSVKLEEWQEECIKFGWGPITKEKYLEYMDSTKLYKNIENDISEAIKDKRLINIINPLNLNKSEMIACAQIVFNNETTTFFRDEWYSKSNPNFIVKYKKLSNGQIIAVERINIKKPEKLVTKLPKAAKGAFKDTIKFEFFKGVDGWFTVASGAIAIGTDLSVFQSNGELKSNEDIAKALAAAVIVNGVETMFCAFLGGIIAQCIAPEFPIVAAVAGAAVSAIAAILIGSFVDNHEKEKYLMNSFKGLIDYLF
ncbi:SH3 domain-containing protein [Clostridium perfringens]|uniref:SH3 domain-containing protein n=1 Tax=Clostridium perfringens TaxID=1502 RepID=UPI0024BBFC02|nr:SH3 domain-containing protein [Clostridium perfringens]